MVKKVSLVVLIFLLSMGAIAQELKYERKSISYVNILLVSDPSIEIEQEESEYIIKKLREYIEMPRFDYNPIPAELLEDFKAEVESRGSNVSLDEVVEILKEKFVPKIIEILDIEKEIRAQNLLTEAQRNSFIATKAKALGITAEQAMKIMNSAFICVPVISKYRTYMDSDAQIYTTLLSAGVIWYRVIYRENGEGDLNLIVKKETGGMGLAKAGKTFEHEGKKVDYREYAFRTAVVALARDIQVATRDIPEFRLGAQVAEVYSNAISFPMGTREGIKIDDGFDLVELQENPDGSFIQKNIGFVRVTKVANNRINPRAFSRAQIIIGSGIEPGVYVSERPRLPVDIVIRLINNPFTVKYVWLGEETQNSMTGYSIHSELIYNLGRSLGIPQLWIGAGVFIGGGDAENLEGVKRGLFGGEKPDVNIVGLNGILMRKFYYKRFAGAVRAELILESIIFSKGEDYEWKHEKRGLGFGLGVEYVITPDLNLGLNLGYRAFSESKKWNYRFLSESKEWNSIEKENLSGNHSGFAFSIYVTYSLPKLWFDPIAVFKGVAEE
ncbi:hypothetical protein JGI7_00373 [Candidatus Kryptonium thompsonii]|uniref:Outer membrane protein beta-barrel domain-containing protein n=3 Tax=Candidatus Kryptonium thompsonii TaxID=1633631 RepID=A0A0P1MZ04_9BACT|nr:hypothetical protein [Candidatus Kryptonium thompsoni]CUS76885.1 hypothetical protein JGI12_00057 [Candidatus Kryptonium thompsoni]CUS80027.1 hypothetical protein JGI7_00373 [Candidatus Kryptonium thompsoni]CUS80545.1 hypothetical protein JGI13_00561 [Candidatus Kryptonium thompsoni]CUS85000.1 hypothetical protein JGI10_01078 [Candidatus Kryptonium thompsoni]CUS92068.1 hypothetical protein JGI8_01629 [Candidatus Kryptonium thompsoni]